MKIKISNPIIYVLAILLAMNINDAYSQEEKTGEPKKLDFLVMLQESDSITEEGNPVFNLLLDIQSSEIKDPEKVYVKIISKKSDEIYFIRAIDKEVLKGDKDIKEWEKEKAEKEEERLEARIEKNKTREEEDKLSEEPRYEKQEGRDLKKVKIEIDKTQLEFGPFSPGDYQVYVRVENFNGDMYEDRHNITITPEIEPTEEDKKDK